MIKPIHALYYMRNNKVRVFILILLMSLVSICYVGGLYISSPFYENLNTIDVYRNFVVVSQGAGQAYHWENDPEYDPEYTAFLDRVLAGPIPGIGQAMQIHYFADDGKTGGFQGAGIPRKILFHTLIGIPMGIPMPAFRASEDFSAFNNIVGLLPPDFVLDDGDMVMSDLLRRNRGLEVGAFVENDGEMVTGLRRGIRLAETYEAKGYTSFLVDAGQKPDSVLLLREALADRETSERQLNTAVDRLKQEYPGLQFFDYPYQYDYINNISTAFWAVIVPVCIIVALVLAITINAILIGEYANRKFEFSIYRATGFSKWEISFKIVKEILWMNLLGLCWGALMAALLIFVLDDAILFDQGIHLSYYCLESVYGSILCEVAVIVPIILFQVHRIKKHDVTDY